MVKVITFSLWGNKPIYSIGAIKNVELAKQYYPDFECWFYIHSPTVPENTIYELQKHNNVKIILKNSELNNSKPMMWRFEAIDDIDVEVMLSRDTDTRILLREKLAVDEWLESGKLFHIMRDHPYHSYPIQGGMFGIKKNTNIPSLCNLINNFKQCGDRVYDQDFLRDIIYPIIKNNYFIHASYNIQNEERINIGDCVKPFPIPYDNDYHFVGEYVFEDESRILEHSNMLKN
jgi:hypothetical protein